MGQQHGALTEIVEHQPGQHDLVPGPANGGDAKVAHIGVQGLDAGHHQDHRTQGDEPAGTVVDEELDAVPRVDRPQDRQLIGDVGDAEHAKHQKPHEHDRAEHPADGGGAASLHAEQADQDGDRNGYDQRFHRRGHHAGALHGGEHRDGRGDDAVAVEQRCAEQPKDQQHHRLARRIARVFGSDQGREGEDAALPVVVGLQDERQVLEGHHQQHRPEHQREHADDVGLVDGWRGVARSLKRLSQ